MRFAGLGDFASAFGSPAYWTNYYSVPGYSPYQSYVPGMYGTPPAPTGTQSPGTQPPNTTAPAAPSPVPVQTPNISPPPFSPNSPAFSPPPLPPTSYNTPQPPQSPGGLPVESITVPGAASPPQLQTPAFSPYVFNPNSPAFSPPALSPAAGSPTAQSPGVEAIEVSAQAPQPVQVHSTPLPPYSLSPNDYAAMMAFPSLPPDLSTPTPQSQPKPSGGGGGGGGAPQLKPPQQQPKPLQIVLPKQSAQQQAAQQQAANALTPQQIAALEKILSNPNASAAQKAAALQALEAAGIRPGTGGTAIPGAAQQRAAAAAKAGNPAAPFSPVSFVLPMLIAAGVVVAYQVTHHHGKTIARHVRHVRRKIGSLANA